MTNTPTKGCKEEHLLGMWLHATTLQFGNYCFTGHSKIRCRSDTATTDEERLLLHLKIVLHIASGGSTSSVLPSSNHDVEEYNENVEALKQLSKLKSPAAQTIQE